MMRQSRVPAVRKAAAGEASPDAHRVGNGGGNIVQEAANDSKDPQPMAWKVAVDSMVLDVDEQALQNVDEQDQKAQDQTRRTRWGRSSHRRLDGQHHGCCRWWI